MIKIHKMNLLEYYIAFMSLDTALSRRFATQAEEAGSIYGARVDGAYAGVLIVSEEADVARITYALTVPEYRRQGVFTALMEHVQDLYKSCLRLTIPASHEFYGTLRHTCQKLGFFQAECVHVFSCSRKDEDQWHAFMDRKGRRLCEMLEMHGYRAVCFRDLEGSLLQQLRESDRSPYANIFHPSSYLDDPSKKLSWELSYAAEKDGKLSAYCLVTMGNPTAAMFDQISVSSEELGHGVILLPYVYSMQRFFEMDLESAYYAMYESNKHANAFRRKVLQVFPANETIQENYCYLPKMKEH